MNLYEVISEPLETSWGYGEPTEYCRIAELVIARNPGQAKYLAWKSDKKEFSYDITEMPRFSVHLRKKNVDTQEPRIVTNEKEYQKYWR